jgi:hypothetical protein
MLATEGIHQSSAFHDTTITETIPGIELRHGTANPAYSVLEASNTNRFGAIRDLFTLPKKEPSQANGEYPHSEKGMLH